MRFVLAIPAVLSSLILSAHFLRAAQYIVMGISLAMLILLFFRALWARRIVQFCLRGGALSLLWTMVDIAQARAETGRDAGRMLIIMGSVSAWIILSALLLSLRNTAMPQSDPSLEIDSEQ